MNNPSSITLSKPWRRRIFVARTVIFFAGLAIAVWGIIRLLFPISAIVFNFNKPTSPTNTFTTPRTDTGISLANGQLGNTQTLITTMSHSGDFSNAHISFTPSKKSTPLTGTTATLRRSYISFFLPIASEPARFPFGTLLVSDNRSAIIDSAGQRIDFDSIKTVKTLGYDPTAFISLPGEEFTSIPQSTVWKNISGYPAGTVFTIDDAYYQLQDTSNTDTMPKLVRFVSENAFLSFYEKNQAIRKTADFLKDFSTDSPWLGFASDTLLGFADGVFVIDNGTLHPISDPASFTSLGFDWNKVVPASEEDLGIYAQGKLVQASSPQPVGAIFVDRDTDDAFVISAEQQLQRIPTKTLRTLLARHTTPIITSSQAAGRFTSCTVQPHGFFFNRTYSCDADLERFASLPGNAYELTVRTSSTGTTLNMLEADFSTALQYSNLRDTLSIIKQQILKRYVQ